MCAGVALVLHGAICVALVVLFYLAGGGSRAGWLAALPASTGGTLLLLCLGRRAIHAHDMFVTAATLALPVIGFGSLTAHAMCPLSECYQYDWMSINTVQAVALIFVCLLSGFMMGDGSRAVIRVLSKTPSQAICITMLLASVFWPALTFWGESHARRSAFLMTCVHPDLPYGKPCETVLCWRQQIFRAGIPRLPRRYQPENPGACPTPDQVLATPLEHRFELWDDPTCEEHTPNQTVQGVSRSLRLLQRTRYNKARA